jgi:radical SAM protein with 4Fe4S-binding SPASM domain
MGWRPKGDPLWVNVDGTVSACCRDYHGDLVVGDIMKQSYDEILKGKDLQNLQKAHENNNLKKYTPCDNCFRPDKRLDEVVNNLLQYTIFKKPKANSADYQKITDEIISILNGSKNLSEKMKNFFDKMN